MVTNIDKDFFVIIQGEASVTKNVGNTTKSLRKLSVGDSFGGIAFGAQE